MSAPLQIGVTGGIGSGKSVVCELFSCLGVPVYNADIRAKWLTNHSLEVRSAVTALLGPDAYDAAGKYNTSYVASIVFKDEFLLKKLNQIIHPAVLRDTEDWVSKHGKSHYVIKEAAIMNRAGEGNTLDFVIVVEAEVNLRIARILERDQRSESEIRAIIERQVSDDARKKVADFVINNNENSALIPQVMQLHRQFLAFNKN
ncbi:dephospho-CoA kinase [Dyadobacter aurulentus]|uniref:dephospho-CoA kinase n=1 Tax=Dyadobacter sp. UC 10 TaxID=2605428 RepID=UPI0011F2F355|nr:dephospho-CoA kinase [Dyadobacter sp. UC 10]KAA0989521.1 dephospho-CoA kinase [Dyadobacter sp. UC 10]